MSSCNFAFFVVVVALLAISAVVIWSMNRPSGPRSLTQAFFVDEDTNAETVMSLDNIPPLKGAGGKETVVRVYKYSCDEGGKGMAGYYVKYTPEMRARLQALKTQADRDNVDATGGTLVRSPSPGSKWVAFNSPEGKEITTITCPSGKFVTAVFP